MKSINLIYLILIATLSSCAVHNGMMSGNTLPTPEARLVDMGVGVASTEKILGIGGLKKQALVLEAKKSLYATHPLQPGQSYANMSVDFKNSFFFLYNRTTVTVSADIMEWSSSKVGENGDLFKQIENTTDKSNELVATGDDALFFKNGKLYPCKITKVLNKYRCLITLEKGPVTKTITAQMNSIFIDRNLERLADKSNVLKVGDTLRIKNSVGQMQKATVVAVSLGYVVVEVPLREDKTELRRVGSTSTN
ncbi:MAG: DUF6567 family protein [Bacteroidota bacterium]